MNVKIKKILFCIPWIFRIKKIFSLSRKYRKTPDLVPPEKRSVFITKCAKKYLKLHNIKVVVKGLANVPEKGGVLLAPNHKHNIDPLIIMHALSLKLANQDDTYPTKILTFIAKKELLKKRVMRNILALTDSYAIDRQNFRESMEALYEFGQFVKQNKTYGVIFPEGTRVKTDEIGEFKGGAFKIAQKEFIPIIPVSISNSKDAIEKAKNSKVIVTITFHKLLKPMSFITQETKYLATRVQKIVESGL